VRQLREEARESLALIEDDLLECVAAEAALPASVEVQQPTPQQQPQQPATTLFDFNFTKTQLIETAAGTTVAVTTSTTAAAQGTTITTLGGNTSLKSKEIPCRYVSRGCKRVLKSLHGEKQHAENYCEFRRRRQASIRPTTNSLTLFMRPQILVGNVDEEARADEASQAAAALSSGGKKTIKRRKDGKVDNRSLLNRGVATCKKYSPLFKARVVRAYEESKNMRSVAEKFSQEAGYALQETMIYRYVSCICVCASVGCCTPLFRGGMANSSDNECIYYSGG